jgi:hypothetical protein
VQARPSQMPLNQGAVVLVGLATTVVLVLAVFGLTGSTSFDVWGAVLVAPLLIVASLPALARQARREGNRALLWILVIALSIKLLGAVARHHFAYEVYEGTADAAAYDEVGTELALQFREGNYTLTEEDQSLVGTRFIEVITGVVYSFTGSTQLGGFVFFSWLGFWGLFFLYRAFVLAVPEGSKRSYVRLLFFLPSMVYWPSSIGKESWMVFSIGITAFGLARALSDVKWHRGVAGMGLGLGAASMVRPHIAGMLGLGIATAFLLKRPKPELRQLAPLVKGVTVAAVIGLALLLVVNTEKFLDDSGIETDKGVTTTLNATSAQTYQGGSAFVPSLIYSPQYIPTAVATVLFRPFPFEVQNSQQLLSALEGSFLLVFSLARMTSIFRSLKSVRRQPYIGFAIGFIALFIFAFSSFANFGLLVRERTQMLPLYVALLATPTVPKRSQTDASQQVPAWQR